MFAIKSTKFKGSSCYPIKMSTGSWWELSIRNGVIYVDGPVFVHAIYKNLPELRNHAASVIRAERELNSMLPKK